MYHPAHVPSLCGPLEVQKWNDCLYGWCVFVSVCVGHWKGAIMVKRSHVGVLPLLIGVMTMASI